MSVAAAMKLRLDDERDDLQAAMASYGFTAPQWHEPIHGTYLRGLVTYPCGTSRTFAVEADGGTYEVVAKSMLTRCCTFCSNIAKDLP